MNFPIVENTDKTSQRSDSFDESRTNIAIISNTLRGTTPSKEYKDYRRFYHAPRLLPSITSSAKAEHRRSLSSYKAKLKAERKRKSGGRSTIISSKNRGNRHFNEGNLKSASERNSNSSNGQLLVSLGLASEQGGRLYRSSYNYSDITPMATEQYNREPGTFVGPNSPPAPYPKPLTLAINPRNDEIVDPNKTSGQMMYPIFTNKFRKESWRTVKKSTRNALPKVRKPSPGCCSTYVATVKNIQSKWSLLFLVHCGLFLLLAGYIVIGASMLIKTDGGARYAVRGSGELQRTKDLRQIAAERLLNISLKSVVEKSRDAVLDTIFTSDTLQAALAAFKTSRVAFLPADHELQLLSLSVLEDWENRLNYLLVRYHFISTMETMGFQMTQDQLRIAWGPVDNSEKPHIPMAVPWTFGDASIQCFCLISTMGFAAKSPSDNGKASFIIYAIFGIPLYWWVIFIWSRRLLDALLVITRTSANTSNRRKVAMSEEDRILTPNWNSPPPYKKETPPFLIFASATLTIAYVIGLGPLACGTVTNSFGERLEAAFFSLLTVRPPAPLPGGFEAGIGFILYILNGHLMIGAFIRSIKMVGDSIVGRIFSSPTR